MKGMMFKEDLFASVVNGTKTQTRRTGKLIDIEDESKNARYKKDDVVYLKEPFYKYPTDNFFKELNFCYKYMNDKAPDIKWKNKMFMPASAARYHILITGVKVQPLHSITEEDAIAEGIANKSIPSDKGNVWKNYEMDGQIFSSAINSFHSLWDSINKKKCPWESNPWVYVYEFALCDAAGILINKN